MLFSRLFRRSTGSAPKSVSRQRGYRLRLEGLEDRTVLATLHHFSIEQAPASAIAGSAMNLKVIAQDENNETVTDYTGTIHFNTLDSQAIVPHDFTFTLADQGVHTFSAMLFTAGKFAVRVTDVSNQALHGSTGMLEVAPAALSHFEFLAPKSVNAGEAFGVSVIAKDAFGNTVTGYTGSVYFNCSDGDYSYRQHVTFAEADLGARHFGVILRTAGLQAIRFSHLGDQSLHGSLQLQVVPNDAAHFDISIPTVAVEGKETTVVVTAMDAFGNVIENYTGTVHFNSSDPNSILPDDHTFTEADKGKHEFNVIFGTTGTHVIRISDVTTPEIMFGNVEVLVMPGRSAGSRAISKTLTSVSAGNPVPISLPIVSPAAPVTERVIRSAASVQSALAAKLNAEPELFHFDSAIVGKLDLELTLNTPGTQSISVTSVENPGISSSKEIDVVQSDATVATGLSNTTALVLKGSNRPSFENDRSGPKGQQGIRPNRRTVKRVLSKRDDVLCAVSLSAHMN